MGIRVQCGIAQEQAQVQVKRIRISAEDHAIDIHQHNAAQIVQIKPQRTPDVFHGFAQGKVAKQADGRQQGVTGII